MIESTPGSMRRTRRWLIAAAVIVTIGLAVGLSLFQPWRVFTNRTVVEALPSVAAAPTSAALTPTAPTTPAPTPTSTPTAASAAQLQPSPQGEPAPQIQPTPQGEPAPPPTAAPAVITLATGSLISHEHDTTGTVSLLQLPDGTRIVRLAGLETSDGPDLRIWLTDAPVIEGRDGWFVFDDGRSVDLGSLKANRGDQNYEIPADADIDGLTSLSIWCQRFSVSFGAAELLPA